MKAAITWFQWWTLLRMTFTLLRDVSRRRVDYTEAMAILVVGSPASPMSQIDEKEVAFLARFGKPLFFILKEEAVYHGYPIRDLLRRAVAVYVHVLRECRTRHGTLEIVHADRETTIQISLP